MHKYPKTLHLPWSPGRSERRIKDVSVFIDTPIIITEKMDGANTTITKDGVYIRSLYKGQGEKWSFVNKLWAKNIETKITDSLILYGENLFEPHKINYELPTFFFLFNAYHKPSDCIYSWTGVEYFANNFKIPIVPILFKGIVSSLEELESLTNELGNQPSLYGPEREGIVIRIARDFFFDDFHKYVAKWVYAKRRHQREASLEKKKKLTKCRYCDNFDTTLVKGTGYLCEEHAKEM